MSAECVHKYLSLYDNCFISTKPNIHYTISSMYISTGRIECRIIVCMFAMKWKRTWGHAHHRFYYSKKVN